MNGGQRWAFNPKKGFDMENKYSMTLAIMDGMRNGTIVRGARHYLPMTMNSITRMSDGMVRVIYDNGAVREFDPYERFGHVVLKR